MIFRATVKILLTTLLIGCQGTPTDIDSERQISENQTPITTTQQADPTLEPFTYTPSDPGYATVHGNLIVLDPLTMLPANDDAIYLVPMESGQDGPSSIPQFTEGSVPQATVDERTGEFVGTNLETGRYAVVVVTQGGAQIPARIMGEGSLAIFNIEQSDLDTTVELGALSFP